MDVYKLYGTAAASADAIATLDIQRDGWIVALSMHGVVTAADALGEGFRVEVSFASTNGITTNDTKASIAFIGGLLNFLTSGGGPVTDKADISGIAIPVMAGERIYMHTVIAGAGVLHASCYLYVMEAGEGASRAAVRRR